ncbi:MAG: HAD family hydrolase [Myxococcota bacterium]
MLVILDIDETLVYSTPSPLNRSADDHVVGYHVYYRPGVKAFIHALFGMAHVAVWTASDRGYATPLLQGLLGPDLERLMFFWTHNRCTVRQDLRTAQQVTWKPLRKVRRMGVDLRRVLIVDNTPSTFADNYGNGIAVRDYLGAETDDELPLLQRYITSLRDVPNVRAVEKRGWRHRLG